jgi:HAD superfamily hydrolase (TIGR01490 family)
MAFFDIEGTLTSESTWSLLMSHPRLAAPARRRVTLAVLPAWLAVKARLRGDVRFRHAWIDAVAACFRGWRRAELAAVFAWVIDERVGERFRDDVVARLDAHRARGEGVVLVSGMYDGMVEAVARRVGADAAIGSPLVYDGDRCAGRIQPPPCVGEHKLTRLRAYLTSAGLAPDLSACTSYADSFSDVPLLAAFGHAVATYPEPALLAHARGRGWEVIGA